MRAHFEKKTNHGVYSDQMALTWVFDFVGFFSRFSMSSVIPFLSDVELIGYLYYQMQGFSSLVLTYMLRTKRLIT